MAGRHPFDDPFFRDPFGMGMGGMGSMMGRMDQIMGSMFNDPFFAGAGMFGNMAPLQQLQQQPYRQRLPAARIEEVDEGHTGAPVSTSRGVVEEPDEDGAYRPPMSSRHQGPSQQSAPPAATYAYSSSSFMSNQNGVQYHKSTQARMGPGGVKEVQSTERDGRTGKESITVSRALGDKARTIVRTRDATGRETSQDLLKGIQQDEAHRFDNEWLERAEQNLPGAARLAPGAYQQQQQRQYALPSSTSHGRMHSSNMNQPPGHSAYYQGTGNGPEDDGNGRSRRRFA